MANLVRNLTQLTCLTRQALGRHAGSSSRLPTRIHKCNYSLYEPDDICLEPEIPEYDSLNMRLRGYDYVVLESFAKYVHNLSKGFGLETVAWPVPCTSAKIQTFQPNSSRPLHDYKLNTYERTVQVQDVPTTTVPLLIEAMQLNLPEGVQFTVKEPDAEEEENRYVPDQLLIELHQQIVVMDQEREDRKKK